MKAETEIRILKFLCEYQTHAAISAIILSIIGILIGSR